MIDRLMRFTEIIIGNSDELKNFVLKLRGESVGFLYFTYKQWGTAVAQWLRRCSTNRKVAGSIPAGVIGIFH